MVGITAYGGYIPRYRLSRMVIIQNMAWYFPVIMAVAGGEKAVANWDEDSISMAVAAARDCMAGKDRGTLDGVFFASTTMPFADRLNAGIIAAAVNAPEEGLMGADFSACLKAGTTALISALEAVGSGKKGSVLVAASDLRKTRMATLSEMFTGDGAGALLVGSDGVIAKFLGSYSSSYDFVDHYKGYGKDYDYLWEERWVRDEGYGKIIPLAIDGFLKKHGMAIKDFDKVVYPCYYTGTHREIARKLGIDPSRVQDNLHNVCGDTGTAHPLLMLAAALEGARPGDRLLLVGFGQGCDVLGFEATDGIRDFTPARGISGSLAARVDLANYQKYTKFRDLIAADLGIRGEANPNTSLTALWRKRKTILGFMGVRCLKCGTPQFPVQPLCVNPDCGAYGQFEDYPFSDRQGTVAMFTGDLLAPSVDPPAVYGIVEFDGGGRAFVDFTDCDLNGIKVGMPITMSFRKRSKDQARGFTGYFWKAVPKG
ncbi:MAG TPA: 3-oxoacyl-[acyl-carrier-protein] synthase III C-terminal domain-containing protein [Deltaproteobacteria bacterium]|nr:3-oxoacyl-[acyl-carrier-protein] synthase III C-terminal domain-containing protein [Deltaproteobacteria bacterium]HOI05893.1 3-oxoacyl-[acyl-carrier-protein] synthase III C-terminal domain-containing protein [Deltaproteobacteria bacterium]